MRFRINKKIGAAAAVNLLALAGFLTLALIGFREGAAQEYNYAAQRWSGEDSGEYAQISCFFSESAGFTEDSADEIRYGIISALQDISIVQEDGCRLCPDAYSAEVGQLTVTGSKTGSSECEITAVGGDFFTIHNFRLLDGAFFTDDDIMQDGAVIDENLAWALFGSCEVSGMDITINGTQFYVSGVVEAPQTEAEAECAGEMPRAYISYEGASGFASGETESESAAAAFKTVTCYEVLMPDPVEDFAYDTVSQLMEGNMGKAFR
ncbi:MAG: ABC transporter permease [Ruminococcus sp.]|nr:ABC transporter permease [Ruminococcus sp.]